MDDLFIEIYLVRNGIYPGEIGLYFFFESMFMQKEVWNALAESWSHHRNRPIKEVVEFLENQKSVLILDLGSGTGRNFVQGKSYIAVDVSENMLNHAKKVAKRKQIDVTCVVADSKYLPLPDNSMGTAICIAVIHCIENDRQKALDELFRVMKKGSQALIMVWNRKQPKFFFYEKERYEPWRTGGISYQRYYHLYSKKELEESLESAGFKILSLKGSSDKAFKLFSKNIVAIVEK